jgi:DNA-binding transcriptional ArsR family regulator
MSAVSTSSRPDACDVVHVDPARVEQFRRGLIDAPAAAALADIFKLLGEVTRVRILDALAVRELCVCDLAALLGLGESAVSHQLRLLRGLRVVRSRRAGRMVFYSLHDQHVIDLFRQGLRHVQEPAGAPSGAGRS